jgi:hypothetical protein
MARHDSRRLIISVARPAGAAAVVPRIVSARVSRSLDMRSHGAPESDHLTRQTTNAARASHRDNTVLVSPGLSSAFAKMAGGNRIEIDHKRTNFMQTGTSKTVPCIAAPATCANRGQHGQRCHDLITNLWSMARARDDDEALKKKSSGGRTAVRKPETRIMDFIAISVLFALMFGVGFVSGYGARARLSRRRRHRAQEHYWYPA